MSRTKYNQVKHYFLEEEFDFASYENVTRSFNDVFGSFNPGQLEHAQEDLRIPKTTAMPSNEKETLQKFGMISLISPYL